MTYPPGPEPTARWNGQEPPAQSQPLPQPPRKRRWLTRRMWVGGVILVIVVIAAVSQKTPTGPAAASTSSAIAAASAVATSSTSVSTVSPKRSTVSGHASTSRLDPAQPATKGAAATVPPTHRAPVTTVAPAPSVPAPKTFRGTGDDIVKVNLGGKPAVIKFVCAGCSGNTSMTSNGDSALLVNVIGPYSGEHVVDTTTGGAVTSKLTITADSSWTAVVSELGAVKPVVNSAKGHGDMVLVFSGSGTQATIMNAHATANFAVTGYGASFPELAVNVIGPYKGTVPLTTPGVVQIESDGDWTITTAP